MKQTMNEQSLTELTQRFNEHSKPNYAVSCILSTKSCNKYTYSDGSVYVGRAIEAQRNAAGHFVGFSRGIPFVRTTKKRHEK